MNCNYYNSPNHWKFNHVNKDHQGYLKSNDIIHLSTLKYGQKVFLRSHEIKFTIGDRSFQEVVCHDERLGGNDEVSNLILFLLFSSSVLIMNLFFLFFLVVY